MLDNGRPETVYEAKLRAARINDDNTVTVLGAKDAA